MVTLLVVALVSSSIDAIGAWIGIIAGVIALLGALWAGFTFLHNFGNTLKGLSKLADHELNHNSGSSIKDKAYAAAENSEKAVTLAEEISGNLKSHIEAESQVHDAMWQAIRALAKQSAASDNSGQ